MFFLPVQLIQTISAVDTDEPLVGHKFVFTISPTNPNFTVVDKEGKVRVSLGWDSPVSDFPMTHRCFPALEMTIRCLRLSPDNTANILTRRDGFSRREMSMYFLPVVISDNDYPIQSSTSTLIVRVCACDSRGNMQSCSPEVLPFSDGLTTGALVAILLCVIILLSKFPTRCDLEMSWAIARRPCVRSYYTSAGIQWKLSSRNEILL